MVGKNVFGSNLIKVSLTCWVANKSYLACIDQEPKCEAVTRCTVCRYQEGKTKKKNTEQAHAG